MDSTFALAWYRLAWAQDFTFDYRMAQSADRAYGLRDRLSPRDRLLAAVTQAYGHAEAARAESLALVAVGTYPDDAEAWWLLGVLRMWDHWRWGRSPLEGLEPFERALALDPVQRQSRWNAAWLLFYQGSYNRADSLIQRSLALGVQTGIVGELDLEQVESRVTNAFTRGSTAEQRALLAELATRNDAILTRLGSYLTRFTDSLAGAEQVLRLLLDSVRRAPAVRAQAHLLIGTVQLAGGRWSAAQEETARAKAAGEVGLASVQRAYFAAVPFLALPVHEVLATRDSLRYWPTESTPEARPEDPGTWAKWYPPPDLRPHLAAYLRGLLSARAGDTADARVQADRLERAREPGDSARLLPDLALEIRALAAAEGGRDSEALALLERMTMRTTWHYQQYASFAHLRPLARYLRGEVLYRLGRYHEALGWYWFGVLGRPEIVFQGPGFLRRGEIYEKLGDPTQAVREYRRFVARWRRSDPRYQSLVRDVDERIARLSQ